MKVHIVKWVPTGNIRKIYLSYEKANDYCELINTNLTWKHKLAELMTGLLTKYVVETFNVKE